MRAVLLRWRQTVAGGLAEVGAVLLAVVGAFGWKGVARLSIGALVGGIITGAMLGAISVENVYWSVIMLAGGLGSGVLVRSEIRRQGKANELARERLDLGLLELRATLLELEERRLRERGEQARMWLAAKLEGRLDGEARAEIAAIIGESRAEHLKVEILRIHEWMERRAQAVEPSRYRGEGPSLDAVDVSDGSNGALKASTIEEALVRLQVISPRRGAT